jgi:valyl-tRNA synthetase
VRRHMRENKGKPLPLEWDGKPGDRYPQMQSARNFANKIWNAARFVLTNAENTSDLAPLNTIELDLADRWIMTRLGHAVADVTYALNNYEFQRAASTLYEFVWTDFCDWYVELSKPKLRTGDKNQLALLTHILETTMRLLHPFMPFISEEIWQRLPKESNSPASLCIATWPDVDEIDTYMRAEIDFALIQEVIRTTRNLRAEGKLPPSQKLNATFMALSERAAGVLHEGTAYLTQLANLGSVAIVSSDAPRPTNALTTALTEVEIFLPLEGLVDVGRESARLQKELDEKTKDLERAVAKLSNPQFAGKAPPAVVAKEEAKRAELQAAIEKIHERLRTMGG